MIRQLLPIGSARSPEAVFARLQGGLGNQLFVLGAGYELATRLGCELKLDASAFAKQPRSETKRDLEISSLIEDLDGVSIVYDAPRFVTVFRQKGQDYDPRFDSIRAPVSLEGFFQSPRYMREHGGELLRLLRARIGLHDPSPAQRTHLHVRRGDYVNNRAAAEVHGTPSLSYYTESTRLALTLGDSKSLVIHSDDPGFCEEILVPHLKVAGQINVNLSVAPISGGAVPALASLADCVSMSLSNSSFSWWGAALSGAATVVAPRPWYRHSSYTDRDLLLAHWLTLDAEYEPHIRKDCTV